MLMSLDMPLGLATGTALGKSCAWQKIAIRMATGMVSIGDMAMNMSMSMVMGIVMTMSGYGQFRGICLGAAETAMFMATFMPMGMAMVRNMACNDIHNSTQ